MPSLTLPARYSEDMPSSSPQSERHTGADSPSAPPYSPITPVLPSATLAPAPNGPTEDSDMPPPAPVPISESDNPDAIALRAAASVLQIQRLQSLRDLKTLERQKAAALADPEKFAAALSSRHIKTASNHGTLGESGLESRDTGTDREQQTQDAAAFGAIPTPQNIVRCPPINWAKYHVVGEALDKLHEGQRSHPTPGEPQRDGDNGRVSEHVIAAPYRPWIDSLPPSPVRTRSEAKKRP